MGFPVLAGETPGGFFGFCTGTGCICKQTDALNLLTYLFSNRTDEPFIFLGEGTIAFDEKSSNLLPNVNLVNVDELSAIKDDTLYKRSAEIPKAKSIIATHINEFLEWHEMRRHVPVLKAVKHKLQAMHSCELYTSYTASQTPVIAYLNTEEKIQKVINCMAIKMRSQNQRGCNYIEAINDYMTGTN